jgi:hypothetical protein
MELNHAISIYESKKKRERERERELLKKELISTVQIISLVFRRFWRRTAYRVFFIAASTEVRQGNAPKRPIRVCFERTSN